MIARVSDRELAVPAFSPRLSSELGNKSKSFRSEVPVLKWRGPPGNAEVASAFCEALYGGTLHFVKPERRYRRARPAPEAGRCPPQLREAAGGGARRLRRRGDRGHARGHRGAGGSRDRHALPPLPDPARPA